MTKNAPFKQLTNCQFIKIDIVSLPLSLPDHLASGIAELQNSKLSFQTLTCQSVCLLITIDNGRRGQFVKNRIRE